MTRGTDGQDRSYPLVQRLERSMLTSWPALSTSFDGDWVIRLADGMTKRSNSVTCLGSDPSDLDLRIDRAEAVFERRDLLPVFRISPLASPALTEALDQRGWDRFDESIVMTLDLATVAATDHNEKLRNTPEIRVTDQPDTAWLDGCRRIDDLSDQEVETLSLMLKRLIPTAGFGRISVDDHIVSLALAVVDVELAGLFEVMTAEDHRRRGFSRQLLARLLRFGEEHGATTGWLAAAACNEPAVQLYRSMGFAEIYRYHYRSKRS